MITNRARILELLTSYDRERDKIFYDEFVAPDCRFAKNVKEYGISETLSAFYKDKSIRREINLLNIVGVRAGQHFWLSREKEFDYYTPERYSIFSLIECYIDEKGLHALNEKKEDRIIKDPLKYIYDNFNSIYYDFNNIKDIDGYLPLGKE